MAAQLIVNMNVAQAWIERSLGYEVAWDDTAAWVQAFGAITGIFWGVWLYRQAERDKRETRSLHRANVGRACTAAVRFAAAQLAGINKLVNDRETILDRLSPVTFDRLAMAEEMLRSVPVLDAEDTGATDALIAARSRIAQARRRCEEYNDSIRKSEVGTAAKLADVRRQLRVLQEKLDQDATLLGTRYVSAE